MLELAHLTKRFTTPEGEPVVALDDASLVAGPGRMVGFVGSNGAGKTTAMRIVLGLLEPDAGAVTWQGRPLDRDLRRRLGYMPEERGLYPKMRVRDQLRYLARLHGTSEADAASRTDLLLEQLGVAERATSPVQDLSLGNQQRVQLAAALVHDPVALVLDEPFSGLDPVGVDALNGVLAERVAGGVPVLFSSHQLDLVERICDEVVVIHAGRVVAAGTVEQLRRQASSGRPRRLRVEVAGATDGWYRALPAVRPAGNDNAAVLLDLDDGVDATDVLDAARAAGPIVHFGFQRPPLADLYRDVVTG